DLWGSPCCFFFSSRRRHTRSYGDWSSDVCSSDLHIARSRASTVRLALQEIADALGDVDAFSEQYEEATRTMPRIAAEIAGRLLRSEERRVGKEGRARWRQDERDAKDVDCRRRVTR